MMILPVSRTRLPLRRVEGQTLLTHRESSPGDGLTRGTVGARGCHIAWDLEPGLRPTMRSSSCSRASSV